MLIERVATERKFDLDLYTEIITKDDSFTFQAQIKGPISVPFPVIHR
jgi:hypothetical protein